MEADDQRRNRGCEVRRGAAADDEISEDEKMERFYALIRNYKEALDRQRMERERSSAEEEVENGGNEEDERRKKKKMRVGDREESSWIPAFKWEDFADKSEREFRWRPVVFPASNLKENEKRSAAHGDVKDPPPIPAKVDGGCGLDLKLRL